MKKDLELQEELPEWYTVSEFKKECKETRLKLQQYIEKNVRETEVFKDFQDKVLKIFDFDDVSLAKKFIFSWSYVNDGEYRLDSGVLDWMKYFLYYLNYNNKIVISNVKSIGLFTKLEKLFSFFFLAILLPSLTFVFYSIIILYYL